MIVIGHKLFDDIIKGVEMPIAFLIQKPFEDVFYVVSLEFFGLAVVFQFIGVVFFGWWSLV